MKKKTLEAIIEQLINTNSIKQDVISSLSYDVEVLELRDKHTKEMLSEIIKCNNYGEVVAILDKWSKI